MSARLFITFWLLAFDGGFQNGFVLWLLRGISRSVCGWLVAIFHALSVPNL